MCGIVGIVRHDQGAVCPRLIQRMVRQVRHRGPDAMGVAVDGSVGLGHARLSILDLHRGRQPMRTADGRLTITFNGEIFNHVELRELLRGKGHRFRTRSDTEVILHAYEEYGADCVRHFNGQWAFALWDRRDQKLLLSRDRLGIRPLYYVRTGKQLLFASEVKSLLVHDDVPRALDPRGMDQLFTFWSPLPPTTVFRGVQELPPGHNLTIRNGVFQVAPYWQLDYSDTITDRPVGEWAERLLGLLRDATRIRLRSDVPVGAYLSGGLDSSVTAALVARCGRGHLRTFSVTFEESEFDESRFQQEVVAALRTDHQATCCSHDDIAEVFPDVIRHTERPVLRSAPAPLFVLSRLVREAGFKVVLTGEGADEMLGGYDLFKEAKVRRFCAEQPASTWRPQLFRRLYPYLPKMQAQPLAYRKAFFQGRGEDPADPFFSHVPRWTMTAQLKRFFAADFRATIGSHDAMADARSLLPEAFSTWHPFCQAQFLESVILMPGYILASQGDRMAMAHSVEGRFPFLDHRLAEFAARIPPRLKMKGLNEKYLLKRATRDLVPATVRTRPKQPYRAPAANSFFDPTHGAARRDYIDQLLASERVAADGVFRPAAVRQLVDKARHGQVVGTRDNMALVGILSTQLLLDLLIRNFQADPIPDDLAPEACSTTVGAPGDQAC